MSNLDVTTSESLTQRLEVGFATVQAKLGNFEICDTKIYLTQRITDAIKANKEALSQEQATNNEAPPAAAEVSPTKTAPEQIPVAAQAPVDGANVAATLSSSVTGH